MFLCLPINVREPLHGYFAATLRDLGCSVDRINSVEDHVHILFGLWKTVPLSKAVENLKKGSSKWIKTQGFDFADFAWQAGYGAFAVSESSLPTVRAYIERQKEHHQKRSFQDEYRNLLEENGIDFDERYVWD